MIVTCCREARACKFGSENSAAWAAGLGVLHSSSVCWEPRAGSEPRDTERPLAQVPCPGNGTVIPPSAPTSLDPHPGGAPAHTDSGLGLQGNSKHKAETLVQARGRGASLRSGCTSGHRDHPWTPT